jgi:succinate dehydrogenase/fumarate reductase flavoprotein subunit
VADLTPDPATRIDVLVAGSGAAGLTAALAAAAGGARVMLAERSDELGGTTALSFGRVWVPASDHAPGDSRDAAQAYLAGLFGERYPEMTEAFIAGAPSMARFVEQRTPVRFSPCVNYPDYHPGRPGASPGGRALDTLPVDLASLTPLARSVRTPPGYVPLTHAEWEEWRFPRRFDWALLDERKRHGIRVGGAGLAAALLDGAVRAGVQVVTGTRLLRARLDQGGAVLGATVSRGNRLVHLGAPAIILAAGGFDRNHELCGRLLPAPVTGTGAAPGNTGDALRIAAESGGHVDNTGQGWWMPMIKIPGLSIEGEQYYQSVIRERALPRQIMVNAGGRRFADEALPYNELGKIMNQQDRAGDHPNQITWLIFDEGFRRRYAFPAARPGGGLPAWVTRVGSVANLAAAIAVDADTLADTIARWNRDCAVGCDTEFGRGSNAYERFMGDPGVGPNPNLGPIDQPPYYAVRVLSGTIGTKGGPVTDPAGRVLTAAGRPVGGLYAAGNAAAFWTGDGYPGPGATLGVAMTMGYLAGLHAAAYGRAVNRER